MQTSISLQKFRGTVEGRRGQVCGQCLESYVCPFIMKWGRLPMHDRATFAPAPSGRYEIHRETERAGTATGYLLRDTGTSLVAIKVARGRSEHR